MSPEYFARLEYRAWKIYETLANIEKDPQLKRFLEEFSISEKNDFEFWLKKIKQKNFSISFFELVWYRFIRRALGLSFTIRFLEKFEKRVIAEYKKFAKITTGPLSDELKRLIAEEEQHEKLLVSQLKEQRVEFISNIVLGLNDGLIELTGALVGFSFALPSHKLVALTGFITGFAASLSMAASSYMHASYEKGKQPFTAALYTGVAYIIVVMLLVLPYVIIPYTWGAIAGMGLVILIIISSMTYYTSIIFLRPFTKQFVQMLSLSVGVACITFVLGQILKVVFGVQNT